MIVARKTLTPEQLADFEKQYHQAKMIVTDRSEHMTSVVRRLEHDLQLLCLTGVEDRLQVIKINIHNFFKYIFFIGSSYNFFGINTKCWN